MANLKLKGKGFKETKLFFSSNNLEEIESMGYPELIDEINIIRNVELGKVETFEFHYRIPARQCLFQIYKLMESIDFDLKYFKLKNYIASPDPVDYLLSHVLKDEVLEFSEWIAALCYMPDTELFPDGLVQMKDFQNPLDQYHDTDTLILLNDLGNKDEHLVGVFIRDSKNPLPNSFVFWQCKIITDTEREEWFSRKPLVIRIDELESRPESKD